HAHAFRHTVGTRMINNGVPQHIVQKFLGHESPEMTARYAHIFHLNSSILLSIIDGYFNNPFLLVKINNGKKLNLINTYDLEHKK
ncbi:tyrosine-type recombinase/integrase, partial [Staphylococcus aureus]|uniref:tyrosine-type recombinase/integrase n=1 Tax=Staphylococcus aureus TaxID=1280 RepID=UPI001F02A901